LKVVDSSADYFSAFHAFGSKLFYFDFYLSGEDFGSKLARSFINNCYQEGSSLNINQSKDIIVGDFNQQISRCQKGRQHYVSENKTLIRTDRIAFSTGSFL
jgi:hypothetical protein